MASPVMVASSPRPTEQPTDPAVRSLRIAAPLYGAAIVASELVLVLVDSTVGLLAHATLILVLLGHFVAVNWSASPIIPMIARYHMARILPVLALVPLLRLLSLALPSGALPIAYWYPLIGGLILLATVLVARSLHFSGADLGLRGGQWSTQLLIALSGPPMGLAAYLLVRPQPQWAAGLPTTPPGIAGAIAALLFAGFVEELLFRGLLQRATTGLFEYSGILWSAVLFGAMYIGTWSIGLLAIMTLAGLFFAWCVARTGAIWGVALANGTLAASALVVCPVLFS